MVIACSLCRIMTWIATRGERPSPWMAQPAGASAASASSAPRDAKGDQGSKRPNATWILLSRFVSLLHLFWNRHVSLFIIYIYIYIIFVYSPCVRYALQTAEELLADRLDSLHCAPFDGRRQDSPSLMPSNKRPRGPSLMPSSSVPQWLPALEDEVGSLVYTAYIQIRIPTD